MSYDVATTLRPEYAEAWYNRGVALGALGRYAEAVASYDRVIAINPGDAEAWYSRGHALRCLGRQEDADASHDKALALDPGCGGMNGSVHPRKKDPG
jgi:Flp pilus assembly protein TadD